VISIRANDVHCHFFSRRFYEVLASQLAVPPDREASAFVTAQLGWDAPDSPEALADRWVVELDRHGVGRIALIASVPGDEESVAAAVARHPSRFVGFFMLDATREDALPRVRRGLGEMGLRCVCLFPALHRYRLDGAEAGRVFEAVAETPGAAVFVHCGFLSIGVRRALGLPSSYDLRLGQPLDLQPIAQRFPTVPIIIPHLGAGFFREALMLADLAENVHLDTSSSNGWTRFVPGLTLEAVLRQALFVVGTKRLIFGTDSSFFPRGWQRGLWEEQQRIFHHDLELPEHAVRHIVKDNFDRLFPLPAHEHAA
jgi:predicted TIM-barrel fold metal-dependent hydrolase